MFFSEYFKVESDIIDKYGAVDISFVCDIPLFIDPMLIFNSEKKDYKKLHDQIIKYFYFLYEKSQTNLSSKELGAWYEFKEIPNNWLGYSMSGNKGAALGSKYADFLYKNIKYIFNDDKITKSKHIEKVMLLYDGSGKDKISDMTVNLIKGFLCEYTEKFAKKYMDEKDLKFIKVDRVDFNYITESFINREYLLPVIKHNGKDEYVLLTPKDILRKDEPAINREDFYGKYEDIIEGISDANLRAYVNNYISKAVKEYEDEQKRKNKAISDKRVKRIEKDAFKEIVDEKPILYDYYIKLVEDNPKLVKSIASGECSEVIIKFLDNMKRFANLIRNNTYCFIEKKTAIEEARDRIYYFKHIIEDCDGYKNFYFENSHISTENDLQRIFKFVWYKSFYKIDAEPNNGRGQADFVVSKGNENQVVIEFKLASNGKLKNVFKQISVYERANGTNNGLIVIFYFSEQEKEKTEKVIKEAGCEKLIDKNIILIDCRKDNKESASRL